MATSLGNACNLHLCGAAPLLPHDPIPAAAWPPQCLLWLQLSGWLLHLLHLDGILLITVVCGDGGLTGVPALWVVTNVMYLAVLLDDLIQRAAMLLLRGCSLLSSLHFHLLHLTGVGHDPAPDSQSPKQLLPLLLLELHFLQVYLPPQPLCLPLLS